MSLEGIPHQKNLKVFEDPTGMPYVELDEPTEKMREIVLKAMNDNDPEAKKLREATGAVLETDGDDEIRIEFRNLNPQPFVDYLNKRLKRGR